MKNGSREKRRGGRERRGGGGVRIELNVAICTHLTPTVYRRWENMARPVSSGVLR